MVSKMEIKILGPGCQRCEKTAERIRQVVAEVGSDALVTKVTDMMEIAGHGVVGTPAVIVDGQVKCSGKVPGKKEIRAWLLK